MRAFGATVTLGDGLASIFGTADMSEIPRVSAVQRVVVGWGSLRLWGDAVVGAE